MPEPGYPIEITCPKDTRRKITVVLEHALLREAVPVAGGSFLAQGLGLVLGKALPKSVLARPTAIFRGLRRPLHCPLDPEWYAADRVHAYVSRPHVDVGIVGKILQPRTVPTDSVFVTYVRFWDDGGYNHHFQDPDTGRDFIARGKVAHWEWKFADPNDRTLPMEYDVVYSARVL